MAAPRPYSATVARELVHRSAVSEVFLTGHAPSADESTVTMEAQLPRAHSYYSDHLTVPGTYDVLLLMEVFRQASIVMAHAYLDAPFDSAFIFDKGDVRVVQPETLHIGSASAGVDLTVRTVEEKRRAGKRSGAVLDIRAVIDGRPALTARMDFRWVARSTWNALRDRQRGPLDLTPRAHSTSTRLDGSLVGRQLKQNVVLGGGAVRSEGVTTDVVVDRLHPALFDHALDHIPGAVMFEAVRQTVLFAAHELLGLSSCRLSMVGVRAHFSNVGEFELPTRCRAVQVDSDREGRLGYEVEVTQEERVIASAYVTLAQTAPLAPSRTDGRELVQQC